MGRPQVQTSLEKRKSSAMRDFSPSEVPSDRNNPSPGRESKAGQMRKVSEVEFDPLNPNKYKPILLKNSKDSATFYPVFESDSWTCPNSKTRFRVSILLRRINNSTVLSNDIPKT